MVKFNQDAMFRKIVIYNLEYKNLAQNLSGYKTGFVRPGHLVQ